MVKAAFWTKAQSLVLFDQQLCWPTVLHSFSLKNHTVTICKALNFIYLSKTRTRVWQHSKSNPTLLQKSINLVYFASQTAYIKTYFKPLDVMPNFITTFLVSKVPWANTLTCNKLKQHTVLTIGKFAALMKYYESGNTLR